MSDMKSTINFGYLIFLSVVAALGGFLFGYDTAVISGTIAQVTQLFQLDTLQQGWYVGCALIGSIVGVLFAGILSDKLGRKMTMIISATLFSTSALGCAISADFTQLVVYLLVELVLVLCRLFLLCIYLKWLWHNIEGVWYLYINWL